MSSKRKNRRKKKLTAELAKELAGPGPDEYGDWGPKKRAANGKGPHWLDKLTPAERRQYDAEMHWAARAYREDLPGPPRLTVVHEYYDEYVPYGRGKTP